MALGGNNCVLNFENKDQHVITVRATDNGSTPLYVDYPITIHVQDVNDQPRSLDLSHNKVLENMPAGTVVGNLSSTDEDSRQTTTYTLTDDDNGMFKIFNDELQKATSANYETMKAHSVVVMAVDDGSPPLQVWITFVL